MRVVVVGGGTAGHVIPALPVIRELKARGYDVAFVGTHSGLEERLVADAGVEFHAISAGKLRRYFSFENFTDLFRIGVGLWQAWRLLGQLQPVAVFSKGGFVSFPVAAAAWLRRVRLVAHESDLSPGLANRLVLPFAATLCTSFAATFQQGAPRGGARVVHTGTPIREEMLHGDPEQGRHAVGLRGMPLLVVTGGSLGADRLNEVVREAASKLTERYDVLHVCGPGKTVPFALAGYSQREYIDDGWGDILAAAQLVISRAGANALFEILALRKPNLLIPLTAAASRGDQIENAAFARGKGYSLVLEEESLSVDSLVSAVAELEASLQGYTSALAEFEVPDAARIIADEIEAVTARDA